MTPSRARRNARKLQAFLKRKTKNQNEQQLHGVGSHIPSDVSLKTFIDQDVQCAHVDFQIDDGEPRT